MKLSRIIVASALIAALGAGYGAAQLPQSGDRAPAHSREGSAIVFVLSRTVRPGPAEARFPEGSRIVSRTPGSSSASGSTLTPDFFAAADPRVSFDGRSIVFAGQKSRSDSWQLWQISADGRNLRQITHCAGDCLKPVLLAAEQIAYTMVTHTEKGRNSTVYVCESDGAGAHPITFGPGNYETETALHNGRIVLSALWPPGANGKKTGERTLYTIRPDGSGLAILRDGLGRDEIVSHATELADGTILFVQARATGRAEVGGQLARLSPGALRASPVGDRAAVYQSATELPGNILMASRQRVTSGGREFELYTSGADGQGRETLFGSVQGNSLVDPVALQPHPAPERYWSILHPNAKTGRVICLDAYLSQEIAGEPLQGKITEVRVLGLDTSSGRQLVLGQAPVEADGSFYAAVPANMPIRFELLGLKGEILRAQQGWVWSRNGEDRGCLGCHESKTLAPANHWPLALRRFDTPVLLDGPVRSKTMPASVGSR